MHNIDPSDSTYAGYVLLAHPSLLDPNFRRSVVLIFMHTRESGAAGLVINRPLGQTLGEITDRYADTELADVPVYQGGPVRPDHILLAAWGWNPDGSTLQIMFGLEEGDAVTISNSGNLNLCAFLGHAGWGKDQLEFELQQDAWILVPIDADVCDRLGDEHSWRSLLHWARPDLDLLALFPDDLSLN